MTLTPEQVEGLAKHIAVKLETEIAFSGRLANELVELRKADVEYREKDLKFKEELRADMNALMQQRIHLPRAALAVAAIALMLSLVTLVGTAKAQDRIANELEQLRRAASGQVPSVGK